MKTAMLAINDVDVSSMPVLYTCHGLGSCIGLFITDRLNNVSGGAHIALSRSGGGGVYPDALQLMDEMLGRLHECGSDLNYLRAKITGGAKVVQCSCNIGQQNVMAVVKYLVDHRIFIAAADVGGFVARTAVFNSVTCELSIVTSDQRKYFI